MSASAPCEAVREMLFLARALDDAAIHHLAACAGCRGMYDDLSALARALASDAVPVPGDLAGRVRRVTAPLLARNARRVAWRSLARAVGVALLPLPLVVLVDVYVLRTAYAWLSTVLPDTLSLYLVLDYTALLALLLTLAYGAIPLLTDRQLRLQREESYG